MRKYSSPYLIHSLSSTKVYKERTHNHREQQGASIERYLSRIRVGLPSKQVKHRRRDSSIKRTGRSQQLHTQQSVQRQSITNTMVYSCEVSYNSHLFRMEFEYNMEHTTIGMLVGKVYDLLGTHKIILRSGILVIDYLLTLHKERFVQIASQNLSLTAHNINMVQSPNNSLKQFNLLKCIGSGGFSKVYLAEIFGEYLALKIMDKEQIISNQKQSIILNEKAILMKLRHHPFITKLHYTIETENTVTFAVEFCAGGELFNLLKRHRRMKEDQARFYFLQVLSALLEVHRCGIIYRDLKPQNIVIDHEGHVRLADFGLSKFDMPKENNQSFCGSAQYMAPEMLARKGHNQSLDVYCLGALLYELVVGIPPFYSKNVDEMFYGILNERLQFPQNMGLSEEIEDLFEKMLLKSPELRPTMEEVLNHKWCCGYTLQEINSKRLHPPFKPDLLKYNFDDSEFAQQETEDMLIICNEKQKGDLVLPLFRRFYYESEDMKFHKRRVMDGPAKRSFSHTSDTILKRSSQRKLRLRTEEQSSQMKRKSHLDIISGNNHKSHSKNILQRKLSNFQLATASTISRGQLSLKKPHKQLQNYDNLSKNHANPLSKNIKMRPLKKTFKGKDYLKQLFGGRI